MTQPLATGVVTCLCLNGIPVEKISFTLWGPQGDKHSSHSRVLSGHDGEYIRTSDLQKGDPVFNHRTWTGLSVEEVAETERNLGVDIPPGTVLENIRIAGIPDFSKLTPTTRLVFPASRIFGKTSQTILAVWEENGPCRTAGEKVADLHGDKKLTARYVKEAIGRRGVMGLVYAAGFVEIGDTVLVYPPVT